MANSISEYLKLYQALVVNKSINHKELFKMFDDAFNTTAFSKTCLSCSSALSSTIELAHTTLFTKIYNDYNFLLIKPCDLITNDEYFKNSKTLVKNLVISSPTNYNKIVDGFKNILIYNPNSARRSVYNALIAYNKDRLNYFKTNFYKSLQTFLHKLDNVKDFNNFLKDCLYDNVKLSDIFVVFYEDFAKKFSINSRHFEFFSSDELEIYTKKQIGVSVETLSNEYKQSTTAIYNTINKVKKY